MTGRPVETWENYRYEIIPIENLFVDKDYQRRLTSLAREIGEHMIPPLLPTFMVSAREESGRGATRKVKAGAVFDGQTRLEGSKRWNNNVERGVVKGKLVIGVPSTVYTNLTQAEEAQLFVWIQTKRRNATSYESFYGMLKAPEDSETGQQARALKTLVESTGYEIGYSGMSDNTLPSASTLMRLSQYPEELTRALTIYHEAWKERHIPKAAHIRGMVQFLRERPEIEDDRLVIRISLNNPADLEEKAENARKLRSGKTRGLSDMVDAIEAVYTMRPSQVERRLKSR